MRWEQWVLGSFSGALASQKVTEAFIKVGYFRMEIGKVVQRQKPALLQDRHVAQLRKQNLVNRPLFVEMGETPDKSYPGDNRLVGAESPYRRACSTPRCRLILSWG